MKSHLFRPIAVLVILALLVPPSMKINKAQAAPLGRPHNGTRRRRSERPGRCRCGTPRASRTNVVPAPAADHLSTFRWLGLAGCCKAKRCNNRIATSR